MTTTIVPVAGTNIHFWWIFLLRGLLFMIAGILTFRFPLERYVTLSVFFGAMILFTGLLELAFTLSTGKINGWGWRLAASIIDLIVGIILLLNIGISVTVLPFPVFSWTGPALIAAGIFNTIPFIQLKKTQRISNEMAID